MKSRPKIGAVGELRFLVEQKHVIDFATDGMPAVLSTPNLVGLLERTARETLQPFLEPSERTVGIELDLRHSAPTPLGQNVTCTVRIIHVEGTQVTFQVEARDALEVIARGIHRRAVVRIESFARRVVRKTASR
jgi:fluoroacetyl-CoA thioesterase